MENARELDVDTEKLQNISVKTYELGGVKDYGIVPSELEEIFPELVVKNAKGEAAGIRHLSLISLLLAEVQRLSKKLDELE
ncbi:hypothetical protein C8_267 [Cannes 8 virus]|nr:hypothetical protein C8_267 [Cannes 8 virus]ANB78264.1 hypothetical protein MEL_228b [Melbournevirus]